MNNEFTMSIASNFGSTSQKVGVTTTMKEQVDNIQITIEHFKKCLQSQRKQQSEVDNQLNKLQVSAENQMKNMLHQIKIHTKQIIETFRLENQKQDKDIDYLDLQKKILDDQHSKLNELAHALTQRVGQMEENVGI